MSNPSINDLRDLSDEDVRLLYDIVTAAETSPAPPFRALFAAYETVLAKRGISKDHDQLYLRFLLRMGEGRKAGRGLYDQFESLLDRLGFQVAFDADERGEGDEEDPSTDLDPSESPPRVNLLQTQPFRPARRASFDSALDITADPKPLIAIPIRSHSTNGSHSFQQENPRRKKTANKEHVVHAELRGGLKQPDQDKQLPKTPKNLQSNAVPEEEPHESDETLANDSRVLSDYSDSEATDEDHRPQVSEYPSKPAPGNHAVVPLVNVDAYKRQLEANAKTLKYHHVAARAVLLFRNWRDTSRKSHQSHQRMFDNAQRHDASILKQQALDQWRLELRRKRQRDETERFFENLEIRAGKARDLFLLTKAFTHWAQCASEESSRKSAARKLILQTRYFNAWRDITVVNELKARRQQLSKFLSTWIKRTERVFDQQDEAAEFNSVRSVHYAYRQWFWSFCERRTPSWYISKRKASIFRKWVQMAREALIRNSWALDFRHLELQRNSVVQWTQRSSVVQKHQSDAVNFRRRALLAPTVETLRRETQLAPLQAQACQAADWRLARGLFCIWRKKARDVLKASRINELRVMRNAWTQWNDLLRCQALSKTIDDRVMIQSLYKWVLAERLAIYQNAKMEDLCRSVFSRWRAKMNSLSTSLGNARYAVLSSRQRRVASSTLRMLSITTRSRQKQTSQAIDLRQNRLIASTFAIWAVKSGRAIELDKWAADGRFYMLTSKPFKTWHTATVTMKRDKRREAFASFRIKILKTRATNILNKWRIRANEKSQLTLRGKAAEQQRAKALGNSLLDLWRERLSTLQLHDERGDTFWAEHTLIHNLQIWISRVRQVQEQEARATEFFEGTLEAAASASLRKLNWKAFQLKRHQESADSLLHRNRRKHRRHMLRYWTARAVQQRELRQSRHDDEEPTETKDTVLRDFALSNSALIQRQTPFAKRVSRRNESQSMPRLQMARPPHALVATPGYLRTPSRRISAGKLRAPPMPATQPQPLGPQAQGPSTPANTRITPFMNRLRAQYKSSSLAFGSGLPRRELAMQDDGYEASATGFDDIPESSPLKMDESRNGHEAR